MKKNFFFIFSCIKGNTFGEEDISLKGNQHSLFIPHCKHFTDFDDGKICGNEKKNEKFGIAGQMNCNILEKKLISLLSDITKNETEIKSTKPEAIPVYNSSLPVADQSDTKMSSNTSQNSNSVLTSAMSSVSCSSNFKNSLNCLSLCGRYR